MGATIFDIVGALEHPYSREVIQLRNRLYTHPVFASIRSVGDLQILMEHHVWAVWDFMSLIKSIQASVAPIQVPWSPPCDAEAARLINEIMVVEESDEWPGGGYGSHFSLYLEAMKEAGADCTPIEGFLARLGAGERWPEALRATPAPPVAREFVTTTLQITQSSLPARVAAFTVGREELIPTIFRDFISRLAQVGPGERSSVALGLLQTYLERHIVVDEERHGPMARRLFERICLTDTAAQDQALEASARVLRARHALWDGARAAMNK